MRAGYILEARGEQGRKKCLITGCRPRELYVYVCVCAPTNVCIIAADAASQPEIDREQCAHIKGNVVWGCVGRTPGRLYGFCFSFACVKAQRWKSNEMFPFARFLIFRAAVPSRAGRFSHPRRTKRKLFFVIWTLPSAIMEAASPESGTEEERIGFLKNRVFFL